MNERTTRVCGGKMVLCAIGACVLLSWLLSPSGQARGAGADDAGRTKAAAREALERELVEVLRAFRGQVDIYLAASEVKAGQPAFSGVRVSGLIRAGGTKFIHITDQMNQPWRINVEKIVAYRTQKK